MTWLISTSLRLRVLVLAVAIVLVVLGIRSARTTPLDVFPEFALPMVEIQTEAPGLSTEEVESLVTVPLENALNGTPWLHTLRSKSVLGLSSVVLLFDAGTGLAKARQAVQERLSGEAGRLPAVAKAPVMLQPLSSTSRALKIGMWSEKLSQMELTELAKWTIRPRLMAIQGVANVAIWGQRDRQLQVLVDPDRLRAHGVSLDAVERATRDAAVVAGSPPPIGDAVINDGPGLLLIVEKQPWGNTLAITRDVEAALDALRPGLKDVNLDSTIFRPATFIEMSLRNLEHAMLVGCLLVVAILAAFLFDWRTALISMVAIPLSVLTVAVLLHYLGGVVNTLILAGLVISLREVVDDAIIDVENVARRLRLNRAAGNPVAAFKVVLDASLEVRSAVVFASLIVVLVFLPVFFLEGLAGSFFRPLAFAYVLAIAASLLVALTVTPALCLILLPRAPERGRDAPLVRVLKRAYRAVLPGIVAHPWPVVAFLGATFAAAGAAIGSLGEEFLPAFQERDFLMHWVEKPGTSLDAMRRITVRASRELRAIPGVRNFGSHIGRAEVADEVVGPNFTELWISIDPEADYGATLGRIQEVVDGYPGLYRDVLTYLKERIKEVLTGASATVVVRIFGPELDGLREKAQEVARAIADVPGVVDLKVEPQVLAPQVQVRLRPEAAGRLGLTPGQIRRAVTTMVRGAKVGEIYQGKRTYDVAVWGAPRARSSLEDLRRVLIETPGGGHVPLGDVAEVAVVPAPNEIKREGASRRLDVTFNVRGRDLGAVARDVESRVRNLPLDRGYHPEILGEYRARQEARTRLLSLAGLALLGILVLLHTEFGSLRLTLLVFVSLPFALIGGVGGAFLSGGVLSLGSLIGFITVLGIAARNGIMLISHYRHLEENEGEAFGPALFLRGAEERLSPILMTALCTGLALLPLVLAGNLPAMRSSIHWPW